jgi:hypothetical protein
VPITISTPTGTTSITQPDDITAVGGHIFVGFQNAVGADGTPTPKGTAGTGNLDSTIVEFSTSGSALEHWNVLGHVDGLTVDPTTGKVIATANEDASAKIYQIDPGSPQVVQYSVPSLPHFGGLDGIAFWHGMTLMSASSPGVTGGKPPPQASYPAVYVVTLNSTTHAASVRSLFYDGATATKANAGESGTTTLALTDPDSNLTVPTYAQRFGGQFALNSQGDLQQIFVADPSGKTLSVLKQSQAIDDFVYPSGPTGTLYVTDGSADLIYKVTGPFVRGSEIVAVAPCNANSAPMACPAPGFKPNYLGEIDQSTGTVTELPLSGLKPQAKGLLFVP